jgi:hypothetical protein
MIKIYIGNNFDPQQVVVDESKSIRQIYNENSIAIPSGSIVTMGSRRLGDKELDKPLSQLGTINEDELITFTQKLNGAN